MRMTFRMRGVELPPWTTQTGLAVNRVWLEYLRRELRTSKVRLEHEHAVAYALAGSPQGEAEARFNAVGPSKKAYLAHLDGSVHRTEYKRKLLEERVAALEARKAEMDRLDWIGSSAFNLAEWFAGR